MVYQLRGFGRGPGRDRGQGPPIRKQGEREGEACRGGSDVLRGAGVGDIVGEVDDGGALRLERRGFLR